MIKIIIGVVLVMLANVFLGVSLAQLKKEFNKENLLNGIFKIIAVALAIGFMYLCSYLNPDIMVMSINGQEVNLISGINLIGVAGIIYYGAQSLKKLADLIKVSTALNNKEK